MSLTDYTALFIFDKSFSAYTLRYDIFKATKLLAIRESALLFVVNQGYGLHVFNMTLVIYGANDMRDYIIGEIDIVNDIKF
jgi:hypothetical protein